MGVVRRHSTCEEYTGALAAGVGSLLRAGDVLLLRGQLGSGKTMFTRALATALGVDPRLVSSPTFVLLNVYAAAAGLPTLVHIDAYRLGGPEDLDSLGWDRFVDVGACRVRDPYVLVIEWPERIGSEVPSASPTVAIDLAQTGPSRREITLDIPDAWEGRVGLQHLVEREPVLCRVSGRWVSPTAPSYPFADERSRMADLGKWFSGSYTISRPMTQADEAQSGPLQ